MDMIYIYIYINYIYISYDMIYHGYIMYICIYVYIYIYVWYYMVVLHFDALVDYLTSHCKHQHTCLFMSIYTCNTKVLESS